MPYIGKSPSFGVRNRFVYVASSGDTSVSGADANGATLTFTDGAFVDVYLNGVLLKPTTDYNTSTANTIAGLSALNTSDEVTVVVYDVFAVSDTVSATSGGTFSGAVTFGGGITGNLNLTTDAAVLNFGADGDVDFTHVADIGLTLAVGGQTASNFGTASTAADNFIVGGTGNVGISILTDANQNARLNFGDVDDTDNCQINVNNDNQSMTLVANGNDGIKIDNAGSVKFPQLQNLELTALNKAPHIKTTDQLTQLADDGFVTVSNSGEPLQGLLIVTNYNLGHTGIFRHDYASSTTTLISGNSGGFANSDSDGYICVYTASNSYDVYIKNRQGAARDIKALFLGTYQ